MTRKIMFSLIAITLLLFAGCSTNNIQKEEVTDFESCVAAGNPVMESYPMKCSYDNETYVQELTLEDKCRFNEGNWIESAKECEGIGKETCEVLGGNFNECASACRNNAQAEVCTMQCVLVCEFEKKEEEKPLICTKDYNPVCGIDGKTYGNSCMAGNVGVAYNGECSKENAFKEPKICTKEYAPVCGMDGVSYSNRCMAGDMQIDHFGECFSEEQKKACELKGGEYGQFGMAQMYQCNMPTKDAGKSCENSQECEGLCMSENETGVCSEWSINFGCIPVIEGGEEVFICID